MSISALPQPFNRVGTRTRWYSRKERIQVQARIAAALLTLAAGATFMIWMQGPVANFAYESAVFLIASGVFLSQPWHRHALLDPVANALWLIAMWGPFPSRNNFAQFLEIALPAALWLGIYSNRMYFVLAAVIFGAGIGSASRAGSAVLITEAVLALLLAAKSLSRRARLIFAVVI